MTNQEKPIDIVEFFGDEPYQESSACEVVKAFDSPDDVFENIRKARCSCFEHFLSNGQLVPRK